MRKLLIVYDISWASAMEQLGSTTTGHGTRQRRNKKPVEWNYEWRGWIKHEGIIFYVLAHIHISDGRECCRINISWKSFRERWSPAPTTNIQQSHGHEPTRWRHFTSTFGCTHTIHGQTNLHHQPTRNGGREIWLASVSHQQTMLCHVKHENHGRAAG